MSIHQYIIAFKSQGIEYQINNPNMFSLQYMARLCTVITQDILLRNLFRENINIANEKYQMFL